MNGYRPNILENYFPLVIWLKKRLKSSFPFLFSLVSEFLALWQSVGYRALQRDESGWNFISVIFEISFVAVFPVQTCELACTAQDSGADVMSPLSRRVVRSSSVSPLMYFLCWAKIYYSSNSKIYWAQIYYKFEFDTNF